MNDVLTNSIVIFSFITFLILVQYSFNKKILFLVFIAALFSGFFRAGISAYRIKNRFDFEPTTDAIIQFFVFFSIIFEKLGFLKSLKIIGCGFITFLLSFFLIILITFLR